MKDKISQLDKGQMKRILGVLDLFGVGYGDMGSSIYYALGITTFFALGATPIALLIAGVVFIFTALTYAEMSSVLQDAGGSASFSRKAFNDLISFIAGWGLLLDYIVTISISAYAVSPYLAYFIPILKDTPVKISFSLAIVIGLMFLNIRGSKHSTRVSLWLTVMTLITQIGIVIFGIAMLVNFSEFISHLRIGGEDKLWSPSYNEFLHGIAMAMVAYTGIESMSQLSAEAINPGKTVPRAIIITMVTLILMYLGISLVALSAITPQELTSSYLEDPISGIVTAFPYGKHILAPWIGLLASVILISAANAGLIGASRLSFNMGEFFQLPRFFYHLHSKYMTPYTSLIFFGICAGFILIASRGQLSFLADLYNFGAMLAFFSAHMSLIVHRIRFPDEKRPFMVSLNIPIAGRKIPITAILGAFATASVWILVVVTKPYGRYLGFIWMIFGLFMYFFHRRQYKISPIGKVEVEKVKIDNYKNLEIKKILLPTRGTLRVETIQIGVMLAKAYDAVLVVVHIIEVPVMLPLSTNLLQREVYSSQVLSRAKAIALEKGVRVETRTLRSRSVKKSIVDIGNKEDFDLIVLGSQNKHIAGAIVDYVTSNIKSSRVWVCKSGSEEADKDEEIYAPK